MPPFAGMTSSLNVMIGRAVLTGDSSTVNVTQLSHDLGVGDASIRRHAVLS